ncbi:2581_t:CDS:2 [Cetraspora pellucida]|uniref:2581_t:CDS:1 n=1 Tax=Cetraspora pellucida TaxID=1433469 RepID=A0ACA9K547_9GLOM|nr:2581_t:CDS:2 [Cetraspora pellucida]
MCFFTKRTHKDDPHILKSIKQIPETWLVKPCRRRPASSITEVLDAYYIPEILKEEDSILTNKIKDPVPLVVSEAEQESSKQVIDKNGLEDDLEDLIDSYLETLKT